MRADSRTTCVRVIEINESWRRNHGEQVIMRNKSQSVCLSLLQLMTAIAVLWSLPAAGDAQERRVKTRISNAAFTITALPLLAARDWGIFPANGLDVEIILMNSAVVPPALVQGDIDYQAGVGPASVNATLSGFPSRAMWFSSDKISYWLMARPQYKTLESLKSKKIAISGLGGTIHVAYLMSLEKLGAKPKDYVLVSIPGQQSLGHRSDGRNARRRLDRSGEDYSGAARRGQARDSFAPTCKGRDTKIEGEDYRSYRANFKNGQRSGDRNLRSVSDHPKPKRNS